MRTLLLTLSLCVIGATSVYSDITERKLESAKRSATNAGKLIGFIFYEDITQYTEQRDQDAVSARNAAAEKAIPRARVVLIEINKSDDGKSYFPACVPAEGKLPRVVITDSFCKKALVTFDGVPNREKAKEIDKKIDEAVAEMRKQQDAE